MFSQSGEGYIAQLAVKMKLVVVLLILAAISTPGNLMSMEFGFGFGIENGIEKSTCSAKFKVTYKKQ